MGKEGRGNNSTCPPTGSYTVGVWGVGDVFALGGDLEDLLSCQNRLGTDEVWQSLLWEIKAGVCLEMLHLDRVLAKCSITAIGREN